MVRLTFRRSLVSLILAVVVLLSPSASFARPFPRSEGASASEPWLERGLGMLRELLTRLSTKVGIDIDPNGASATPPTTGDEGPDIDPDGASAPAGGDEGPDLDPNGVR